MTLGELKASLAKFDTDMDSSVVFLVSAKDGKKDYDLLAGTGYLHVEDTAYIALVADSEIRRQGLV